MQTATVRRNKILHAQASRVKLLMLANTPQPIIFSTGEQTWFCLNTEGTKSDLVALLLGLTSSPKDRLQHD